jgi:archaellum component FlaF (FlaF/FlaG flagellin family)
MKKIFITIAAVAALAGCAKETLMDSAKEVITFDNTFVDKATRAAYDGSYNNDNLNEFQVYATITGTGSGEGTANIFNGERVVKGNTLGQGANWSYAIANTQYWIPGNTYTFRVHGEMKGFEGESRKDFTATPRSITITLNPEN